MTGEVGGRRGAHRGSRAPPAPTSQGHRTQEPHREGSSSLLDTQTSGCPPTHASTHLGLGLGPAPGATAPCPQSRRGFPDLTSV